MPRVTIDQKTVDVEAGTTVLEAAGRLGIEIPALCYLQGYPASTSCMACVVRVNGSPRLVPSCATVVRDGMRVDSETDEIRTARRTAIELLLGEHLGDCIAPCQAACPAHMNIPRMNRCIAAGRMRQAIATVKDRIALPAILGRICPAPCERACRRADKDGAVAICLLKRHAADADLASGDVHVPACEPATGRRVAVVGAGPAGLAAAFYLLGSGHACTLFDAHDAPGGMLRYAVPDERLDRGVLDAEIAIILALGADLRLKTRIESGHDVRRDFDAVIVATGQPEPDGATRPRADEPEGIFAAGAVVRPMKMAVSAVADGHNAALHVDRYLRGGPPAGPEREFSVHVGRLDASEIDAFMAEASDAERVTPSGGPAAGFNPDEAQFEAARCMHCDCRKPVDCKLRHYAALYGASTTRYRGERRRFEQQFHPQGIVFEAGKCIDCGLCIEIGRRAGERLGLTFIGRGFNVRVAVPFGGSIAEGLERAALECAKACPTGALASRDEPPDAPEAESP